MKKLFDKIDWTATGLIVRLIVIWTMGLLVGATTKPAEVRAKDSNPNNGIQRIFLDGHLYYWREAQLFTGPSREHLTQPLLIHAAGCTNHAPCAQSVLQLEK